MCRWTSRLILCLVLLAGTAAAQDRFAGIGRAATADEIAAWDIDVRADFTGLPRGSGTVTRGEQVWDRRCASCHGTFGESNEMFLPIIGGTTPEDVKRGRVASLTTSGEQRTTMMKLSQISTLWDYIRRAMPWNEPRTLSVDDVYAVTAYILNLADLVPADFTLNEQSMREVQQRLPNRNGLRPFPGLSDVRGKSDVRNNACMKDCLPGAAKVLSVYPDSAKDTHGNLADQHRLIGPVRGVVTAAKAGPTADSAVSAVASLVSRHACQACHAISSNSVGPALRAIGQRYAGDAGAEDKLFAKVRTGGAGVWGTVPMPSQTAVPDEDLRTIIRWVLGGAR